MIKTALNTLCLIIILTSAAAAQVGGPADMKPAKSASASAATPKAPSSVSRQFEKEGVVVDFTMQSAVGSDGIDRGLAAGSDATVAFKFTDKRTGLPVTGLHPKAWLTARKADHVPNEAECRDKIKTLMGGLLSVRADVDLNSYVVLTLNHDNTVTFINPQISFNITKLESIVTLPGAGADWALSKDKNFVYLSIPDKSQVVVISTITRKIVATIETGEKTRPLRVQTQPDGRYIWVGLDGSPLVAVIDPLTNKLAATVAVGEGLHNFAFTTDSRFAYVTNSSADTVTAVDIQTLKKVADIRVGKTPVPVAYSAASGNFYVGSINGGTIAVINPATREVVKTIELKRGIVALKFEPKGRYAFAVNQIDSTVTVIDASTDAVIGAGAVVKSPDLIAFTGRYAYVRGTGSEKFSLIETEAVAKNREVASVEVQAGRQPASVFAQEIGISEMIAPTPEGNGAIIANTADMMLYYYVEGMMAPMGTFQNYKRRPHALMIVDRSLAETAPGVYTAPLKLTAAGVYDVPMVIDQPRLINCFDMEVATSADGEKSKPVASVMVEPLFKDRKFNPGEETILRFKITDSITKQPLKGLTDVSVLLFEPPGIWQQRKVAKEVEPGLYEVSQNFPRAALINVMVQIQSRGVKYRDLPLTQLPVVNKEGTK